ncbi:MAG: deoxyribodipyrimidine photo-lyase, partial [Bacteroidota bacterium]
MSQEKIRIFWFRRDLRLQDNHGLYQALKDGIPVLPLFIFDRDILDQLEDRQDRRVEFIHQCLQEIKGELAALASDLLVRYGKPLELFKELSQQLPIESVYCNHDYEPYALERDKQIKDLLEEKSILFHSFKDQCIFEKKEVLSKQGKSYTIFTPYSKMWKSQVDAHTFQVYPSSEFFHHFIPKDHPALEQVELSLISLEQMDFKARGQHFPSKKLREDIVEKYDQTRDYPAIEGTTRLSV